MGVQTLNIPNDLNAVRQQYGGAGPSVRRDGYLFDIMKVDATAAAVSLTSLEFFLQGTGNGKARELTNMVNGGRMNDGQFMLISEVAFDVQISGAKDAAWADLYEQICRRGVISGRVGQVERFRLNNLMTCPFPNYFMPTQITTATHNHLAGRPGFVEPFLLEQMNEFSTRLDYDNGPLVIPSGRIVQIECRLLAAKTWKNLGAR